MLSKVDLNQSVDKDEYRKEIKELENKMMFLQQEIKNYNIPVLVSFEGWSASGKGTLMSKMLKPLDPRLFNVYTLSKVTEEMKMRPFLWSYWTKTPLRGRIAFFDKGWARGLFPEHTGTWSLTDEEKKFYHHDINAFEKQLVDGGTVIMKFFLHISKEEQSKRFNALEKTSATCWRVNSADLVQNENYDKNIKFFEQMIYHTNRNESPWHIIEANDKRFAALKIYKIFIARIEEEIQKLKNIDEQKVLNQIKPEDFYPQVSILSSVDMSLAITDKAYKEKLKHYQRKMSYLGYKLYSKRKSVVIVYEGWDAAGKGGNIKRVTEELDPRGYEVVPIAGPTREELDHHYLWRFYNKLPKDGHIAIFDRSWYGRVMVEKIEGFCSQEDWQRAYKEINDMELHLINHDITMFKFWINIDKDEQLRRFEARQKDPLKQYKITDEDWRNREKWEEYELAVNEMLIRTSTEHAPWTIVESNDKKYARIKTLKLITEELEKKLGSL